MKKFLLPVLLTALSCPHILAAENPKDASLTLAGAAAQAAANNPALEAARRQLGLLEADIAINSAYPNPGIEIDKSAAGGEGYEIKAVQPVPLTRRAGAAAAASRAVYEAAQKDLQALEAMVRGSARTAWYSLRIARERRSFEETNLKFSMDLLNRIEMKLQTGEAGNADLARAKVETLRSGFRLREAETAMRAAAGGLNALLGRRPDSPAEASDNDGFSLAPAAAAPAPLEELTRLALARRAEPRALELGAQAADLAVALEKSRRLPVPELGLIHGRDGGAGYSRLFLGLELPLWYNNRGEIKKALAHKAALGHEARRLELAIRLEVYNAWLELDLAGKRLAAARETIFLLNDLRRTASQDYLSGKADLTAFYQTNGVFLEENVNYLDALKEYYEKTAQLDAAVNSGEEK